MLNQTTVYRKLSLTTTSLSKSYREHKYAQTSKYIQNKPPTQSTYIHLNKKTQRTKTLEMQQPNINYYSSEKNVKGRQLKCQNKLQWKIKGVQLRDTKDSMGDSQKMGKICIDHFRKLKLLGKGKHGTVYLALHKRSGFIGALKIFNKQDFKSRSLSQNQQLQNILIKQLKIQSFTNHSHILKVYSIFSDSCCVYLFMQLGTQGQLFDKMQKYRVFKQESISFVMRGLMKGMRYLHSNGIIHRDIKPENIVLIHGFPKLCDFGESAICNKDKGQFRQTLVGTPLYLSPQILLGEKYDEKIDIWALGALSYQLLTNQNPFNIKNKNQLTKIITQQFKMTTGSSELRQFLIKILKKDPQQRPSASQLLTHPFILKYSQLQTSQQLCNGQ